MQARLMATTANKPSRIRMVRLGASDFWTACSSVRTLAMGWSGSAQDGFSDCLYERHRRQPAPHNNARPVAEPGLSSIDSWARIVLDAS